MFAHAASRSRRGVALRRTATTLAVALLATLTPLSGAAAAQPRVPGPSGAYSGPGDIAVPSRPLTPQPQPALAAATNDPGWQPTTTRPVPGAGEVLVPAAGLVRVGTLPVWIGRSASGTSPKSVRVTLLDPTQAEAIGGRFFAVRVERTDGGQIAAPITLVVDYSGTERAFGGNFASRLRLSSVPDCALTTPEVPACLVQEALPSSNDLVARRLSIETTAMPVAAAAAEAPSPTPTDASPSSSAAASPTPESPAGESPAPEPTETLAAGAETAAPAEEAAATSEPEPTASDAAMGRPQSSDVPSLAPPNGLLVTMTASSSSAAGNYGATPLQGSGTWQAGGNTGNFGWTYPIPLPPAPAGPTPSLSLGYSSQAVDGRTSAENGQPSQVGEGWSFSSMFIERRYIPCSRDGRAGMQDLCYQNPEYFLHFNGRSGELVRVSPSGNDWRLRDDPTWRIRSFTGASNGDTTGDYWDIRTPDGTQYVFGYGREPTTNALTNSAWLVPVYGDDNGEPCYSATLANAWCVKAWRWNLDRIVDLNSNVTTLFWSKEQNYYSRMGVASAVSQYDRGGTLDWIEYGERNARENWAAPAYVDIRTSHRCLAQVNCGLINSGTNWANYPDVPGDQFCWSSSNCAGHNAPTFFSTEKITEVRSYVKNNETTDPAAAVYSDVDEILFYYSFPANPDQTSPSLFLTNIARDGLVGTRVELPLINIDGQPLANRVNPGSGETVLYHWRVTSIEDELGKTTNVTYGQANPCQATPLPVWHANTTDCFQHTYKNPNDAWVAGAFRKFLVTQVVEDDTTIASVPSITHTYSYEGSPAWHYDNLLYLPAAEQSWSDWRGYGQVQITVGNPASGSRSISTTKYFRGMNGDKATPTGTARLVNISDSQQGVFADNDWFAGRPLEATSYSAAGSNLKATLYRYWAQNTVLGPSTPNSFQAHNAQYVRAASLITKIRDTSAPTPTYRLTRVDTTYETTYGLSTTSTDLGDTTVNEDNTCVSKQYTVNGSAWLLNVPSVTRTYNGTCSTGTQVGRTETRYDGLPLGTAPTAGNVTHTTSLIDGVTAAVSLSEYDLLGRIIATTAPNEVANPTGPGGTARRTTVSYNPASGYPYLGVTTTNPLGHTTKADIAFAWGTPWRVTDENNQVTTIERDGVGRTTSIRRPLDPAGFPGTTYRYVVSQSEPSYVVTNHLNDAAGTYRTAYGYLDSFGRTIEEHRASPSADGGRLVTQTRYDDQGRVVATTQPLWNNYAADPTTPNGGLLNPATTAIPAEERYTYDNLGRRVTAAQYSLAIEKWRTTTSYFGLRDEVDHPVRGSVTRTYSATGRVASTTEALLAGNATTTYTYTPLGDLESIIDALGNKTQYTYDWMRRRTDVRDPDHGLWKTWYDRNGNVVQRRDGRSEDLYTKYDALDRQISVGTTAAADDLAAWSYDTATKGIGRLASTTSIDGGNFVTTINGYDEHARVTGKTVQVPATAQTGNLAGSYTFTFGYDVADRPVSTTFPAVGGLAAETVTTTFDAFGNTKTLVGSGGYSDRYVDATDYSRTGRVSFQRLGALASGTASVSRTYTYDEFGRTVDEATSVGGGAPAVTPFVVGQTTTGYDAENNVTSAYDGVTGQRECFRYEDLANRLTAAFTTNSATCSSANPTFGPDPYHRTFVYNAIDNVTRVRDELAGQNRDYTYPTSSATAVRPHAVTSIARTGGGSDVLEYNDNGAMTRREVDGTTTYLCWDRQHRLASVRSVSCSGTLLSRFIYDAQGQRLLRESGGVKTLYLDGMEVADNGTSVTATRYYADVAQRRSTGPLTWLLTDRQGSTTTTIAADANPSLGDVQRQRYLPYGGRRGTATVPTDRRFLGKTEDPSGLNYFDARYYDSAISRFVSVDALTAPGEPAALNAYSYAANNPATNRDPSGLMPCQEALCDPIGTDATPDQVAHANNVTTVAVMTSLGIATPDEFTAGETWSEEERKYLSSVMLSSPCVSADMSACEGNHPVIFQCVMSGQGGCDEFQEVWRLNVENNRTLFSMALLSGATAQFQRLSRTGQRMAERVYNRFHGSELEHLTRLGDIHQRSVTARLVVNGRQRFTGFQGGAAEYSTPVSGTAVPKQWVRHAEGHAVAQATAKGVLTPGSRGVMYVTTQPCSFCVANLSAVARRSQMESLVVISPNSMYVYLGHIQKMVKVWSG